MVKEVVFTDQSRASSYNLAVNTPHNPIIKVAESAQVFSSTAAAEGRVRSPRLSQVWNSSDDPWSESLQIPLRPPLRRPALWFIYLLRIYSLWNSLS